MVFYVDIFLWLMMTFCNSDELCVF